MAIRFAAGDYASLPLGTNGAGCCSFFLKTTQVPASVPAEIVSQHDAASSAFGWGLVLNPAGTLNLYGKATSAQTRFSVNTSAVVNDGLWHHIVTNVWYASGQAQQVYVDGVLSATQNSSATWGGSAQPTRIGRSNDSFWTSFVGDITDFTVWGGGGFTTRITAEQAKALAAGFNPFAVVGQGSSGADAFRARLPLLHDARDLRSLGGQPTLSGTSFVSQDDLRLFL